MALDLTADNGGEVTVHWFTPVRKRKCRRSRYGKGVWSPVFIKDGNRRIPDRGIDSVNSACFTFRSLLQSGKLPTAVWTAVEKSVPTASLEESADEEENDEEGGEGGGGGAPAETSRPPPPGAASRPVPPAAPRVAPPANLRLTAAHFRPRRGQSANEEEDRNEDRGEGAGGPAGT